jgi:hypothetical protein
MRYRMLIHAAAFTMLMTVVGCSRQATLQLDQDFAPPAQRQLALTSTEACFAEGSGRQQLVATFPLPGAQTGPRTFVLYLDVPAEENPASIGIGPASARGFLAQEVGQLKGTYIFDEGRVEISKLPFQPNWCTATLDLRTERGARLRGKATFERSQRDVRRLSRPIASAIEALVPDPTVSDTAAAEEQTIEPAPASDDASERRDE